MRRLLRLALAFAFVPCSFHALAAAQSVRLNGPLARGLGRVSQSALTRDGLSVLYVANGNLYRVASTGGPSTALDAPLGPDWDVLSLQLDAAGSRAVFAARQGDEGEPQLFGVAVAGGPVTPLAPGASFALSPDGAWVVFRSLTGPVELFSVPTAGGAVTRLNGPLVAGGDAFAFLITPDSTRVVYRADQRR